MSQADTKPAERFIWWNAFSAPGLPTGWHYTEQRHGAPIIGPFATRAEAEQHAKDSGT